MDFTVEDILKVFEESDSDEEEPPLIIIDENINQKNKPVDQNLLESLNDIDQDNLPEYKGHNYLPGKSLWTHQKPECPTGNSSSVLNLVSSFDINNETEERTSDKETNGEREKIDGETPPHTYKAMIMMALHQSPNKRLTLNGIVQFIVKKFPEKWGKKLNRNISKVLMQNKCFIKIPIYFDTILGYGNCWMINPTCDDRDIVRTTARKNPERTTFSDYQVRILKEFFVKNAYPNLDEFQCLSTQLGLTPTVIRKWFYNNRYTVRRAYKIQASDFQMKACGLPYFPSLQGSSSRL